LLRFSAGEELRGLDFCARKMGTSLLFRMPKAFQSNPGACKDIFGLIRKWENRSKQIQQIAVDNPKIRKLSG